MALSNWDTLAIDNYGKSSSGEYMFSNNTSIQIYKNWCYISNEEMWQEGCGYSRPVIAEFEQGSINLAGVKLKAIRGKQNSIFLYASSGYKGSLQIFAGIGCYGFSDSFEEYCKLKNVSYVPYDYSTRRDSKEYVGWFTPKGEPERLMEIDQEWDLNPWVGVQKETLEDFKKWLEGLIKEYEVDKEWFNSINWDELLRFNQGDAFFATNFGTDIQATTVEVVQPPLIIQMLK